MKQDVLIECIQYRLESTAFLRRVVFMKFMKKWCAEFRKSKKKYEKACYYFLSKNILYTCFKAWYYEFNERRKLRLITNIYISKLITRYFYSWGRYVTYRKINFSKACRFYNDIVYPHSILKYYKKLYFKAQLTSIKENVSLYIEDHIKRIGFMRWKSSIYSKITIKRSSILIRRINYYYTLNYWYSIWILYPLFNQFKLKLLSINKQRERTKMLEERISSFNMLEVINTNCMCLYYQKWYKSMRLGYITKNSNKEQ